MSREIVGRTMRERGVTTESVETWSMRVVVALLDVVVILIYTVALSRGLRVWSALVLASICLSSGGLDCLFLLGRIGRLYNAQDRLVVLFRFLALSLGAVAIGAAIALARGTAIIVPTPFIGAFALITLTNVYISFELLPAMASRRD